MPIGISVTSLPFAIIVIVSVLALVPLTSALGRRIGLLLVNAGFLVLVSRRGAVLALTFLALEWGLLALIAGRAAHTRKYWSLGVFALLLVLFVFGKRPELALACGLAQLSPGLKLIGFSYVFLRTLEQLRHVNETGETPSPIDHVNYLVPFHMLAAGPIQAYADFRIQPSLPARLELDGVLAAIERIVWGLFKKLVLAHLLERAFLTGFSGSLGYSLFEMQVFFLWLYLDFSSYSDIAVGVGRLLGVHTPENFDKPYLARNMIDFWERWHISLSLWIRRNIFIPLQLTLVRRWGPNAGLRAATVAFSVAFLLGGMWHGISLPFLCWGAMHAFGLVVTNLYRERLRRLLGAQGVKAYLQRPGIRAVATFLTYQYVAASLVIIAR